MHTQKNDHKARQQQGRAPMDNKQAGSTADEAARTHPFNPKYTGENKQFVNPKK